MRVDLRRLFVLAAIAASALWGQDIPDAPKQSPAGHVDFRHPPKTPRYDVASDEPILLDETSSTTLDVPAFSIWGEPQCDSDGDIFYHLDLGSYNNASILKLSSRLDNSVYYKLPSEWSDSVYFLALAASPSGQLHVLVYNGDDELFVVRYSSDGTVLGKTRLETTPHVRSEQFTVFDNDEILLRGYFDAKADSKVQGRKYVVLLDASGRLVKELNTPFENADLGSYGTKYQDGSMVLGDDGNAYMVGGNHILVLSPSGQLVRSFAFSKPKEDKDAPATRINVSGGLVSIAFTRVSPKHRIISDFLVLNAFTGEKYGYYAPSEKLGNQDACFSREEGYTYIRNEQNRTILVKAKLR